jgi:exo-1,4-beta-D-glucosaminidase
MFGRKAHLLVAAVLCLAVLAVPGAGGAAAAVGASPPSTVPHLGLQTLGLGGWRVQSSAVATQTGRQVSTPGFPTGSWLAVTPDDAGAPGTEVGALVQNGACPNVFLSTNLKRCFGFMSTVGPVTVKRFAVPWWFRTDFSPGLQAGEHARLIVNGVVGQADVWVNGTQVATQATVQGALTRYTFDITSLARPGVNSLAIRMYPNDPTAMYTLDNVDWTQIPPDNNTGIEFPVQLLVSPSLALGNAHVTQSNAADLSTSALTVKADVTNDAATPQTATVSATITPPEEGGAQIQLQQSVTVPANSARTVSFTPAAHPELTIRNPQVWWPYQWGAQPLYRLAMSVARANTRFDIAPQTFAIRTITTHLTPPSSMAPQGVRVFAVNGRPFLFRGGGFSEDLFLRYSSRDIANQAGLVRDLGLNGIRTEGKEMPADFYDQMDRAGIMIDAGFQCCDKWQPDPSATLTQHDRDIMHLSSLTIGQRLRNHPSVINFSWSDNAPLPDQERVSLQGFAEADFQEPIIASAEYNSSPILGQAGEKEGPYDWVPPAYWYDTSHEDPGDPTFTNVGGSWGFDSEQSAGHTVPTLDSIKRFLSPFEQAQLWKRPDYNQYHANYEPGHVGYAFGTLFNLDTAIASRYGSWSSLNQYVLQAQVQNYEDTRSQFEAFVDHWTNTPTPSTGTIYWQLNKGWPSLLWTLYNNDYDQPGSYYGAKKANQTIHALYAYDNGAVTLANLTGGTQSDLSVEARVHDVRGNLLDSQVANGLTLPSHGVANAVLRPKVPATTAPPAPAQTFFVELVVKRQGAVLDRNVYWLSTQQDVVDWSKTMGQPQATMTRFADLKALQGLPTAKVSVTATSRQRAGGSTVTQVTVTNTSTTPAVAFFMRADVRRGTAAGVEQPGDNQVLPISWSDNDITLWPGESQTLTATYSSSSLRGASPVVSLSGWNVPHLDVAAATR